MLAVVGGTATCSAGWAAAGETSLEALPVLQESNTTMPPSHMSEALRASVKKVVVLPGRGPVDQAVTGSYEKETKGLIEGGLAGSRVGQGVGTEVGPASVRIPFPILTLPGALIGGISGMTKREIQEFRDELTDDLARAASQPLTNDALAAAVFWGIRKVPNLDSKIFAPSTPIPEDTDAILYVSFTDVAINVDGKDAVITTSANATLRRLSDGEHLYEEEFQYQDRDSLSSWTENENALWHDYTNFARHYIGREISAEVFDRVELQHELRPKETKTVRLAKKNDWQGVSRSASPTVAWELTLHGGDSYGPWTDAIDATAIAYDIEIYDRHRLVYSANQVQDLHHTVTLELEPCKTYRWSVRPSYHVGTDIKFGEWMRINSGIDTGKGKAGKKASDAPAYIYDFASIKIKCGRRKR